MEQLHLTLKPEVSVRCRDPIGTQRVLSLSSSLPPQPAVQPELFIFNELCALKDDSGPCKAIKERFFFNVNAGVCQLFEYGGCAGNANNFLTMDECEETCVVSGGYDAAVRRRTPTLFIQRECLCTVAVRGTKTLLQRCVVSKLRVLFFVPREILIAASGVTSYYKVIFLVCGWNGTLPAHSLRRGFFPRAVWLMKDTGTF